MAINGLYRAMHLHQGAIGPLLQIGGLTNDLVPSATGIPGTWVCFKLPRPTNPLLYHPLFLFKIAFSWRYRKSPMFGHTYVCCPIKVDGSVPARRLALPRSNAPRPLEGPELHSMLECGM